MEKLKKLKKKFKEKLKEHELKSTLERYYLCYDEADLESFECRSMIHLLIIWIIGHFMTHQMVLL